jgi:hypothetical protein
MPLRDHFRPPVWNQASWEGFHGGWSMMMVLDLAPKLPKGFVAEPRVHRCCGTTSASPWSIW